VGLSAVLEVPIQLIRGRGFVRSGDADRAVLGDGDVPRAVPRTDVIGHSQHRELLESELAQGLEDAVPGAVEVDDLHHGLVHEVRDEVGH
jgi:hypothetical protein